MGFENKQTILIVDDNVMNRMLLSDMVGDEFRTIEAEDGEQAVAELQRLGTGISLVLLDYVMPKMNGFEVLEVMNRNGLIHDVPVIMISTESDASYVEHAYKLGVTDFIGRPFDTNIVRRRVMNTLMLYEKQRTLAGMVADQIQERERDNKLMIYVLSHIVEFRNGESGMHVLNVSTITELVLTQLRKMTDQYELTPERISMIATASSLHDIGKIAIPEEVLNKPGRLTDEEFAIMKTHSAIGADMLDDLEMYSGEPLVKVAREICRWHHERYDGRGYPDGLRGEEVPISAQVVALADVYDALTSERVYKPAFSHDKALDMILNGECGTFNPLLMDCLKEVAGDLRTHLNRINDAPAATSSARRMVENSLAKSGAEASSRTLMMLDYERMKFHFYASMSNEVQFELTGDPPMMILSDWSERKLGLPETIVDPLTSKELHAVFGEQRVREIHEKLLATTPEDPIIDFETEVTVDGEQRWLHATIQALWSNDITPVYRGALGKFIDIDEQQAQLRELRFKAYHDPMTGVLNVASARKNIMELLEREPDAHFVLAIADLDLFKQANDTCGHQFGDRILQFFADSLVDAVRGNDIVGRVGGDEFIVFLQCPVNSHPLIERIHRTVEGEFEGFQISVSMGVATTADGTRGYEKLFRQADVALYHGKRASRGQCIFYDDLDDEEKGLLLEYRHTALSDIDADDEA